MTAKFDHSDHTAMRNKMLEKVRLGKATLLGNQPLLTILSSRSVTASLKELTYEAEYDSAEFVEVPVKNPKPLHF